MRFAIITSYDTPHSQALEAKALLSAGLSQAETARQLGIPRSTIRTWRDNDFRLKQPEQHAPGECPHVEKAVQNPTYAYLLGLYLGDGCISALHRGVSILRIFLDQKYPNIILECRVAMESVLPNRTCEVKRVGCIEVAAGSKHWTCLFPQHGPGPKHKRPIVLEPWQRQVALVDHPEKLLRGLIHSDGWRGQNVSVTPHGRYYYPRYQFCNYSTDIQAIFMDACLRIGVDCRHANRRNLAVSRRADVALLDTFIGPKT